MRQTHVSSSCAFDMSIDARRCVVQKCSIVVTPIARCFCRKDNLGSVVDAELFEGRLLDENSALVASRRRELADRNVAAHAQIRDRRVVRDDDGRAGAAFERNVDCDFASERALALFFSCEGDSRVWRCSEVD